MYLMHLSLKMLILSSNASIFRAINTIQNYHLDTLIPLVTDCIVWKKPGDWIVENKLGKNMYYIGQKLKQNYWVLVDINPFIIWGERIMSEEWATAFEQTRALCYFWGKSAVLCFFHLVNKIQLFKYSEHDFVLSKIFFFLWLIPCNISKT